MLWLLFSLSVEADQELGISRRKIELEDRFLNKRLNRLARILLQVSGHPFYGASYIFSIRQQIMHGLMTPQILSGKFGRPHQVAVALPCRAASLVEGPYYEALAAATVSGSKYTGEAGGIALIVGLDVAAGVTLQAE
jgi:hypothetical protein